MCVLLAIEHAAMYVVVVVVFSVDIDLSRPYEIVQYTN